MANKRETGFYWIKLKSSPKILSSPVIGYWDDAKGQWFLSGEETPLIDEMFEVIEGPIHPLNK